MEKKKLFDRLLSQAGDILCVNITRDEKLLGICGLLRENVAYYNWVGFYLVERERELVLGPFMGEATRHTRIEFGKGICGQAAERREIFVVQDVSKESNYLSCSTKVKSEIVLPILKNDAIKGELDIDSHFSSSFSKEDREFLENLCKLVSQLF